MRAPEFWQRKDGGAAAALLAPLGWAYGAVVRARLALARPEKAPLPVLCVGNLVVGGAGKTPVALSIGARLRARGLAVHFLSRGYGGSAKGPIRVDPARHDFRQVGDEPLLLAAAGPTWVSADRPRGCRAAAAAGAEIIVMDDGFQNSTLAKDLSLVVIDGAYGFGNGRVMPAGPLREPVRAGLGRAEAAVIMGADGAGVAAEVGRIYPSLEVLAARVVPVPGDETDGLAAAPVVAFAGTGNPGKFFATLKGLGCRMVSTHAYPDHHPYTPAELAALRDEAAKTGARLLTTEKDAVRLDAAAREGIEVLTIGVEWQDPAALDRLLDGVVQHGV